MTEQLMIVDRTGELAARLPGAEQLQGHHMSSDAEIRDSFLRAKSGTIWLASRAADLSALATIESGRQIAQRLMVLESVLPPRRSFLETLFRVVIDTVASVAMLPPAELVFALGHPRRADRIVAGVASQEDETVVLYRGNLQPLRVPMSRLRARSGGAIPDLSSLAIIDFGQTVRLGKYEASVDAILYELDPAFRKYAKANRVQRDNTLGGAIRRLRQIRNLPRTAFASVVSEKELARIETNKVNPRDATLGKIAALLNVSSSEIATY